MRDILKEFCLSTEAKILPKDLNECEIPYLFSMCEMVLHGVDV